MAKIRKKCQELAAWKGKAQANSGPKLEGLQTPERALGQAVEKADPFGCRIDRLAYGLGHHQCGARITFVTLPGPQATKLLCSAITQKKMSKCCLQDVPRSGVFF